METIPVVASTDDLDSALDYAGRHPHARWYVARRAKALGEQDRIPSDWVGLVAAFGGDWSTSNREKASAKGQALPDGSYPIKDTSDLRRAIQAFGRAKNKDRARRHIIKRAKALGAASMLPDGWGVTASGDEGLAAAAMTPEMEAEYQQLAKKESLSPTEKKRLSYLKSCMSKSTDHEGSSYGVTAAVEEEPVEETTEPTPVVALKAAIVAADKLDGDIAEAGRNRCINQAASLGLMAELPSSWLGETVTAAVAAGAITEEEAWDSVVSSLDVEEAPEATEQAADATVEVDDLAWAAIDSVLAYVQSTNGNSDIPIEALRAAAVEYFKDGDSGGEEGSEEGSEG